MNSSVLLGEGFTLMFGMGFVLAFLFLLISPTRHVRRDYSLLPGTRRRACTARRSRAVDDFTRLKPVTPPFTSSSPPPPRLIPGGIHDHCHYRRRPA